MFRFLADAGPSGSDWWVSLGAFSPVAALAAWVMNDQRVRAKDAEARHAAELAAKDKIIEQKDQQILQQHDKMAQLADRALPALSESNRVLSEATAELRRAP